MNKIKESIVLIGGGGGVYRIAHFLKRIRSNITTIQTTFDHGGHSGQLRDERGVLPPGDIRQAILALADDKIEPTLRKLLSFRFEPQNGSSLDGVTMGNLFLTALTEITGSLPSAINTMCQWYGVKGKVLPVSLDDADLCVELNDGSIIKGEGNIDTRSIDDDRTIVRAFLEPEAFIYTEAYQAIVNAQKIVFCPGDFFTSTIPNTLVNGFKDAIEETKASLICIVNVMTKKAETDGFTATDFARVLLKHIGCDNFDAILCNDPACISEAIIVKYSEEKAHPVVVNNDELSKFAERIIVRNFADQTGNIVRHNVKIASVIASL
ncbi:MAG: gluconeogenesis factor YvcK family protein [Candidatus Paceibacterota bacterium]